MRLLPQFERRTDPVIPVGAFLLRLMRSGLLALGLAAVSLGVGMLGYHGLERLGWTDAFLNASMILGGMGPVDSLHTTAGKIFAGFYALYSGLIVIVVAGILLTPIVHRLVHKFHAAS